MLFTHHTHALVCKQYIFNDESLGKTFSVIDVPAEYSDAVEKVIVPFVTKHCVMCHGPKKKNAGLALHIYTDEKSILKDRKKWHEVVRMVHSGEMPEVRTCTSWKAKLSRV